MTGIENRRFGLCIAVAADVVGGVKRVGSDMRKIMTLRHVFLALTVVAVIAVACGGDDAAGDDPAPGDRDAAAQADSAPPAVTSVAAPRRAAGGPLRIVNAVDVVLNDLRSGRPAFEFDAEPLYRANPQPYFVPLIAGLDFEANIRANLRWLVDQGYDSVYLAVVDGYGGVLVASAALAGLRHPGFDYDGQYDGDPDDEELRVDEDDARQRYYIAGDVLSFVAREAHALGLSLDANIESLAHIINRAEGDGIGADEDALLIAGNLPPPSVEQVLAFLDDVIAAGADRISAEAFAPDYDGAIAAHLAARGVPYVHAGADLGDEWVGYYYALYPDGAGVEAAYNYEYVIDALVGTTNATVFARARALPKPPRTSVTVGAYLPIPCDTRLSIADLYSERRADADALFIDNEFPARADGSAVENCATGTWLNLLLIAAQRQGVDTLMLTSDLEPSIAATVQPGLQERIRARLALHPIPAQPLPVANIILDLPDFTDEDGYTREEFFEIASLATLGLVDDALSAAGYLTVLTYDRPWSGGAVALTYIVTAGGNEDTDDGVGMGPPFWSDAQPLEPELLALLDPAVHPGPVFIHPLLGIPDSGNWDAVRRQFGLPARFSYRNPSLSEFEEYHTSLLTTFFVDADADTPDGSPRLPVTPPRGALLGETVRLSPFLSLLGVGQAANYLRPGDYDAVNVFAAGPLLVPSGDGATVDQTAPYLLQDGAGRYLWTINDLHHEAFTYLVTQAVALALGTEPVLAAPARVHLWSGRQTFALAYGATDLVLNLPFADGELIDLTVYDVRSEAVRREQGLAYQGPLRVTLDKYSLLVVEPAR